MHLVHEGKLYEFVEQGLFKGWAPAKFVAALPVLRYVGPKLPWSEYQAIVGFFRWAYETHRSEAQVRLATDGKTTIKAVVLPQYCGPATTSELESDPVRDEVLKQLFETGFDFIGTIHSHADMGAFQSGTDKHDEETKNQVGLHMTIGKCGSPSCDVAFRVVRGGVQYDEKLVNMADWIDFPGFAGLESIPDSLTGPLAKWYMMNPATVGFPESWKSMVRERPAQAYSYTPSRTYFPRQEEARADLLLINTLPAPWREYAYYSE